MASTVVARDRTTRTNRAPSDVSTMALSFLDLPSFCCHQNTGANRVPKHPPGVDGSRASRRTTSVIAARPRRAGCEGRLTVKPRETLAFIREKEIRAVDLRFMDFPGLWQHFTIPAEA